MIWLLSDAHGGEATAGIQQYLQTAPAGDLLIMLGDVGLNFADTEKNREFDRMLLGAKKPIAFLDGNHENFPYINSFPEEPWMGGKVHRLTDCLVHLMRGNIYTIEGKTFFVFGGCKSSPKWKEMGLWYPGDEPEEAEITLARRNLAAHQNRVDYILTHKYEQTPARGTCCPALQELTEYLEANITYRHWYAGHWHTNQTVDEKHSFVFDPPVFLPEG